MLAQELLPQVGYVGPDQNQMLSFGEGSPSSEQPPPLRPPRGQSLKHTRKTIASPPGSGAGYGSGLEGPHPLSPVLGLKARGACSWENRMDTFTLLRSASVGRAAEGPETKTCIQTLALLRPRGGPLAGSFN